MFISANGELQLYKYTHRCVAGFKHFFLTRRISFTIADVIGLINIITLD